MEITRLPYSEGLLLTQSPQHPEHAFQLQEALALLVPGESLILHLGDEDQYHDVRLLVEQLDEQVELLVEQPKPSGSSTWKWAKSGNGICLWGSPPPPPQPVTRPLRRQNRKCWSTRANPAMA